LKVIFGYNRIKEREIPMKRKFILLSWLILFLISALPAFSNKEKKLPKDLPEKYRQWLEEEVAYIISLK